MPDDEKKVEVPESMLIELQKQIANLEKKVEDGEAKNAGLEELFRNSANGAEPKLREKRNYEPKFHTVRLRESPIAGDFDNKGIIIGWTDRGAYQEIDRSGLSPSVVDVIEVFFFGDKKTAEGKRKAEKIRLLDMANAPQIVCKVVNERKKRETVETGEEIAVMTFDPKHGLVSTGDMIDGYYTYDEIQYEVEIPGKGTHWIDARFCNS